MLQYFVYSGLRENVWAIGGARKGCEGALWNAGVTTSTCNKQRERRLKVKLITHVYVAKHLDNTVNVTYHWT